MAYKIADIRKFCRSGPTTRDIAIHTCLKSFRFCFWFFLVFSFFKGHFKFLFKTPNCHKSLNSNIHLHKVLKTQ